MPSLNSGASREVDAPTNVGFLKSPFKDGKHHFANHVVWMITRKVPPDDGVDAI